MRPGRGQPAFAEPYTMDEDPTDSAIAALADPDGNCLQLASQMEPSPGCAAAEGLPRRLARPGAAGGLLPCERHTGPMTDERATLIQALLGEAESAHATYESTELRGEYDRDWADWYARYAVDHGIGLMLGHDVSADELEAFLSESFAAYEQLDPPPADGWAAYLARRIVAEL